jgi:hypothetical protein
MRSRNVDFATGSLVPPTRDRSLNRARFQSPAEKTLTQTTKKGISKNVYKHLSKALGVADAEDEACIGELIPEKSETAAAVAAAEKQPEPKLAPVAIDPAEVHTQAELEEVRNMALAFQARLQQLSRKYNRVGIKREPGKLVLIPYSGAGSPTAVPPDLVIACGCPARLLPGKARWL